MGSCYLIKRARFSIITAMKKTTKSIFKYLLEFLIVAFGVFLGVFVNDWNAQKKADENTEKTLSFILEEFDSNISKLETTLEYQDKILKSVDSTLVGLDRDDLEATYYTNRKFRFDKIPYWRGFGFPRLGDIVYESAKINGVLQELDISTTKLIARLYEKQDGFIEFGESINNKILSMNSETKVVDILVLFEQVKYDGTQTGMWLLNEMKKTKEELQKIKEDKQY